MPILPDVPEVHIAGVLIHARPADVVPVAALLAEMDGVEVHDTTPEGRLIVVCESTSSRGVFERIEHMRDLPGVVDTALVYQHAEPAAEMEKEIPDADPT